MIETQEDKDAFRQEVAAFLSEHWAGGRGRADVDAFRKLAIERGYMFRYVPKEYGGAGAEADAVKGQIIREEFDRAGAPRQMAGTSVRQLLPTLLACAEDSQKAYFIPPTIAGEFVWCQGYSEPGAGSKLAAVQTKGVLQGDEWVIN